MRSSVQPRFSTMAQNFFAATVGSFGMDLDCHRHPIESHEIRVSPRLFAAHIPCFLQDGVQCSVLISGSEKTGNCIPQIALRLFWRISAARDFQLGIKRDVLFSLFKDLDGKGKRIFHASRIALPREKSMNEY